MRLATSEYLKASAAEAKRKRARAPSAHTVRFGDVLLHVAQERHWAAMVKNAEARGEPLTPIPHRPAQERLHVVIQKGRLFQQEHPEVPVLLNKGRYLVIDAAPQDVTRWDCGYRPCFAIRPVSDISVAFEIAPAPARRSTALPWVQQLVNSLSRAPFEADLKKLVAFGTRFSTSAKYKAAAKLLRDQLSQLDYQVRQQNVDVHGKESVNVIADKVGRGPSPRLVVVVGAHLDSINLAGGPNAQAPGADDDGSGSAGVLAIARALKDHPAVHDLRLLLFGGEEEGLFGSQQYVASLSAAERAKVVAVIHMDMIGCLNSPQPSVLLEGAQLSQALIDELAAAAATYTHLKVQTSLHPFNSDHVSFLNAGIPAVLTIEGTDDANHNIHSDKDTLATINFDLALEILRMNLATAAKLLGRAN
jgi:hypothetical protein